MINLLLNENFTVASQALATLKMTKGYALADILTELHRYVHKSKSPFVALAHDANASLVVDFPRDIRIHLLVKMADIE